MTGPGDVASPVAAGASTTLTSSTLPAPAPKRRSGALRIFLYNWPRFALTWGAAAGAVAAVAAGDLGGGALGGVVVAGAIFACAWSALALAVSHFVYDRSALSTGTWVAALLPRATHLEAGDEPPSYGSTPDEAPPHAPDGAFVWAAVDAGLDAEVDLDAVMPGRCHARIDVYDGVVVRAPSVQRARALTPRAHVAKKAPPAALPLEDESCDVVTVVFSAHEIRDAAIRERFFAELARALRPGGRVLLVEHLRDAANFVAYGPGFLHFQPRSEWLRLAADAGLAVAVERRVTPWVAAFAFEKSPAVAATTPARAEAQ